MVLSNLLSFCWFISNVLNHLLSYIFFAIVRAILSPFTLCWHLFFSPLATIGRFYVRFWIAILSWFWRIVHLVLFKILVYQGSCKLRPGAPHTIPKTSCRKRIMKLVKLEKDSNCGFGMVITCGNTYDTILHGAFIEALYPGSPAEKDGTISPGDQIMFVNGTDVQSDNFLSVVDLLQCCSGSVELVIAKANSITNVPKIIEKEVAEKPFAKTKTWTVGNEETVTLSTLENSDEKHLNNSEKMPIPQPRKKWMEPDNPVSFDVPDLTLNHATNLDNQFVWKEGNLNDINGHHKTRDNIPDIIASQLKYESRPRSCNSNQENIDSVNENFLLPGEVFHVVLDKKGGSLGLNIYQGTESTGSEQRHIFIHSIIANGAADIDGRIKPGDKLLEVNGVLLENLSYHEVVTKLRESPQVAHLVLEKGNLIDLDSIKKDPQIPSIKSHSNIDKNTVQTNGTGIKHSTSSASKIHQDIDPKIPLSFSSLPTTDAEFSSVYHNAKDKKISHCTNSNISTLLEKVNLKNNKCSSSLGFSKETDLNTPKNKLSNKTSNKLGSYRSTPNLVDNSDEDETKNEVASNLYRIKSSECLTSPHFLNPHQALFNIYRKFSFNRGSSSNLHSVPAVPIRKKKLKKLHDIYDYSNPENTFTVSIHKSSRGLGLSICGGTGVAGRDAFSQLIRIRKLYPLQPALECGKLQLGDVILSVNGTNMVGLSNTEALEVLRTTPPDVTLEVFRPTKSLIPSYSTFKDGLSPFCESSSSSASSSLSRTENSYNIETCEFEVTLIKRGGSLGFSITRKDVVPDNSEEGIFVKALIREPAISDGRIQPGDKILEVNGVDISKMSNPEAIEFIRETPDSVTLKLFRTDLPTTPGYTEKDNQVNKPLRWEAVELLNDRMKNKDSGDEGSFPKRKIKRRLDRSPNSPNSSSNESSSTSSSSTSEQEHVLDKNSSSKITEDLDAEGLGLQRNQRPKSLDVLNSSDRKRLPAYKDEESFHRQCSVMCSNTDSKTKFSNSETDSPAKKGFKNLLKWRGSTLPHSDDDTSPDVAPHATFSLSSTSNDQSQISLDSASDDDDEKPVPFPRTTSNVTDWVYTFDVDLDRGWHGRLGFSLCDPSATTPDSPRTKLPNATEVKAVHPGSLADKDGRIKVGDRLVEANRECLLGKPASEVIDILRKTRGLIRMVFCRLERRL